MLVFTNGLPPPPCPQSSSKKGESNFAGEREKKEDVLMDLVGELILFRPMFHYIGFSSILPSTGFFGGEKTTKKKRKKHKKKGKNE